jgi:DNA polymerase/3'-5' exonuclease PolX
MDGFGPILTTHLKEEIDTLLSLEKFGGQKLAKSWAELEVKIQEKVENKVSFLLSRL